MVTNSSFLLSIVIPTYNYGDMIQRAIASVLSQMDARSQLIVVDDGSTDDTQQRLARIEIPENLSCCFVSQENSGPGAARNHGLRLSQGQFVLFLDADDELLPGALESIMGVLCEPDGQQVPDMILGARYVVYPDGKEKLEHATPVSGTPLKRIKDYLLNKRISISHGASVFRKEMVLQRPYPEHIRQGEDRPVFAYLVANATTTILPTALVRIYKHPDSLRHNSELALSSHEALLYEIFEKLPSECQTLKPDYIAQLHLSLFRNLYLGKQYSLAKTFFKKAFKENWRRALKWSYFGKFIRIYLK